MTENLLSTCEAWGQVPEPQSIINNQSTSRSKGFFTHAAEPSLAIVLGFSLCHSTHETPLSSVFTGNPKPCSVHTFQHDSLSCWLHHCSSEPYSRPSSLLVGPPILPQRLSCAFLLIYGHIVLVPQEAFFHIQAKIRSPGHGGWEITGLGFTHPPPSQRKPVRHKEHPGLHKETYAQRERKIEKSVCQN